MLLHSWSFWGYEYAGVYQGTDFRQVHKRLQVVWRSPLFMDVDGNGEITEADRTIIGNPTRLPRTDTNSFTYKKTLI
jgi:hypothetical protein